MWLRQDYHSSHVSIHAPGRGATGLHYLVRERIYPFQFTHPGGVRQLVGLEGELVRQFQFTHPGGVRLQTESTDSRALGVSIHAPGRGATGTFVHLGSTNERFNSRTREGCDRKLVPKSLI